MADLSATMIAITLPDYLASLRERRWRPGALDCGIFLADWAVLSGLCDPIRDLRGTYDTERSFLRILRREGGFLDCCAARLRRIGMVETSQPQAGDCAAVLAPYAVRKGKVQRRPTGAIFVDDQRRGVVTSDMGLVIAGEQELPLLKAWTFRHG